MISPVSRPAIQPPQRGPSTSEAPGKSDQSVGHKAKALIAASPMEGLPNNIQGKVASMIARGLDPTSLLTPPPVTDTPPADPPADTPPADPSVVGDETTGTDTPPVPAGDGTDSPPPAPPPQDQLVDLTDPTVTDESAALDILKAVNPSAG